MEQITEGLMGAEKGVNLHLTLALAIKWPLEKNPNKSKHQQKIIPISSNTQFSFSNQLTQISIQGETETWQQRTSLKMYSQADFLFCCCVCNQQHDVCPDAELHHNVCYCELEFDKEMNAILILVHKSMCLEHLQMVTRAWYQPLTYFQWISFVVVRCQSVFFCVIIFFNLCLLHFIVRFCPRFVIHGFISSKVICSLSPNKHESVQMWY